MADTGSGPGWSDAQWERVQNAITEAFNKASVAGSFLPCYGPLGASLESVRDERLSAGTGTITVADDSTLQLFNVRVNVELSAQQVADESLSSALLAFRRAASQLARAEDEAVFTGHHPPKGGGASTATPTLAATLSNTPPALRGLLDLGGTSLSSKGAASSSPRGALIVEAVAEAISNLEGRSHFGPFACVLSQDLFVDVQRPAAGSFVTAGDAIRPMLDGPLLRSSVIAANSGVVVSLATNVLDLVVATPPKAQFLQVNADARFLFRVYERFILRNKEPGNPGVATFVVPLAAAARAGTSPSTSP